MSNYLISIILLITSTLFAQPERYTKGAENGYAWNSMGNPHLLHDDSKDIYLSGMLERLRLLKVTHTLADSLSCRTEYNALLKEGNPGDITMADMITSIDKFYRDRNNLVIPIMFAYCYSIKNFAGVSNKKLKSYREKLLAFSRE